MKISVFKKLGLTVIITALMACSDSNDNANNDNSNATDRNYDIVILSGRVMDPDSGLDAVRNVGIIDNKIVAITEEVISGADTIDATGLVVAPGFVDTHIHGQSDHSHKMYVRDGMTTSLSLENGSLQVAKFYDSREGKALINYGTGVSHEMARMEVMDGVRGREDTYIYKNRAATAVDGIESWITEIPTNEQLQQIYALLHEGMKQGALMVNSMPGYIRDTASTREIWEVQKIAKEYNRGFGSHPRFGPFEAIPNEYSLGYKEVIANAAVLGQPILLSHNNNQGWQEIVEMTKQGRKNGMVIWAEQYPYAAGGPNAGASILDPENMKKMGFAIEESVFDPEADKYLSEAELIKVRKTNPEKNLVVFIRPKEWVNQWVATPELSIVADSFSMFEGDKLIPIEAPFEDYIGHPRAAGTRGKSLRIARENNIPLMLVVNNTGAFPAKMLCASGIKQMCERGKIQEGAIADITLFSPETVTDNSGYAAGKNGLPSTGIPYVLVNGEVVVRDSKVDLSLRAGQPIRSDVIN